MSENKLRLFEFRPNPEPAADRDPQDPQDPTDPTAPAGQQQDLIGETPLLLEAESAQEETPPQPEAPEACGSQIRMETRPGSPPRYKPFVFESSRGRLLYTEERVRRVEERIEHRGFLLLIKDFHTSSGLGVLRLQGASKYADVLARKKLEEQGALSASERLLLYDVRRERGREFSVLYQIVPREALRAVEQRCSSHPGGMQYADTLGLLRGVLAKGGKSVAGRRDSGRLRACALRLPGALLLLVADGPRFVLAGRYPFMEANARSLSGCLAALRRDVDAACASASEVPVSIRIVETGVPEEEGGLLVSCAAGQQGFELLPPCFLEDAQGRGHVSALPEFMGGFSTSHALGPGAERLLRPLERGEKILWAALCAGIVFCWGVTWYAQQQERRLEAQAAVLRREIGRAAALPADLPRLPPDGFAQRAALAGLLDRACGSPSLAAVWNRLGAAKPQAFSLTSLELDYASTSVRVTLQGCVYAGLQDSQQLALDFIQGLKAGGALIQKHELELSGTGEQVLTLVLEYQNPGREG